MLARALTMCGSRSDERARETPGFRGRRAGLDGFGFRREAGSIPTLLAVQQALVVMLPKNGRGGMPNDEASNYHLGSRTEEMQRLCLQAKVWSRRQMSFLSRWPSAPDRQAICRLSTLLASCSTEARGPDLT